jgi:hypothetical protein
MNNALALAEIENPALLALIAGVGRLDRRLAFPWVGGSVSRLRFAMCLGSDRHNSGTRRGLAPRGERTQSFN